VRAKGRAVRADETRRGTLAVCDEGNPVRVARETLDAVTARVARRTERRRRSDPPHLRGRFLFLIRARAATESQQEYDGCTDILQHVTPPANERRSLGIEASSRRLPLFGYDAEPVAVNLRPGGEMMRPSHRRGSASFTCGPARFFRRRNAAAIVREEAKASRGLPDLLPHPSSVSEVALPEAATFFGALTRPAKTK